MMKHTEDFKREAVRIAVSSGLPRRRVAADLGVGLSTLGKWVSQYRYKSRWFISNANTGEGINSCCPTRAAESGRV